MNERNVQGPAAKKIADFLQILTSIGGLDLKSNILACNGQVQPDSGVPTGAAPPVETTPPAIPAKPIAAPDIKVEFSGPDTSLLLAQNGELLHAIEHIVAKILRLEPEDHDRISFDAEGFKASRDLHLQLSAETAIQKVRSTREPFAFPPMTSRERRILHLTLTQSGLPTASSGIGPRRFVVLYPEGTQLAPESYSKPQTPSSPDRTRAIRDRFRPR